MSAIAVLLRWTGAPWEIVVSVSLLVAIAVSASAAAARRIVARPIQRLTTLLRAIQQNDHTVRARQLSQRGVLAQAIDEVGTVGTVLDRHAAEATDSSALVTVLIELLSVAVIAFTPDGVVYFANRASSKLLGRPTDEILGSTAHDVSLTDFLTGAPARIVEAAFGGKLGRYDVRRSTFRRSGAVHTLIVIADLSQVLRDEERLAWRRLIRVLSHEINNSLTPIKSISHSLGRIVDKAVGADDIPRIREGLTLIHERSGALARFIRSYAALSQLQGPVLAPVDLSRLVQQSAAVERRRPVSVTPGPDLRILGDPDQLSQMLINLIKNAAEAALPTQGRVHITWTRQGRWVHLLVEDDGVGLPDDPSLFVPFFTTKSSGSGIGLALSRQIAESHRGTLELQTGSHGRGAVAIVRLPCGDDQRLSES